VHVAIVGCGVRGSLVAALLAGAGVEELALIDGASVEEADLGSHPLQFTPDLFASKPEALTAKLGLINAEVHAQPFPAFVAEGNAEAILTGSDCVVDCSNDDFAGPLIAEACATLSIPLVAPPEGFDPAEVTPAFASAIAALQAELALGTREASAGAAVLRPGPELLA
jgi:molybdopterin/thiamine biosynthesis adenylyltransferase